MTTESELEGVNVLHSLKPKDSGCYDGISIKILKHCACIIIKPLNHTLNCSLMSGICPNRCKFAIVRPIHKNGKLDELNNYRPISLLTAIYKILETLKYQKLLQHLETNNILTPAQYGFRKVYHINDAIFNLVNNITNLLDQRKHVGRIFCDLTKASYCVNHETVLTKLNYHGVKGLCLSWFKS